MSILSFSRQLLAASAAGIAALAGVVAVRWISRRIGIGVGGLVVGMVVALVLVGNVFSYRETAPKWHLTPETAAAQAAFLMLYFTSGTAGGFLGSYVSARRSPGSGPAR